MKQDYNQTEKELNYDNTSLNEEDIIGTDIKINPDFYIHKSIVKVQDSFDNVPLKEGMARFRIHINQLEIISKACGNVRKDFNDLVKEYVKSEDFLKIDDEDYKGFKIAEYKFKLIMEDITKNRVVIDSLNM